MRKGDDKGSVHLFRSEDRFFRVDDAWYYAAREQDVGPFPTLEEARMDLRRFVSSKESLDAKVTELKKLRREGNRGDPTVWNRQVDMI
ncbi:MAG: hypothetical protein GKR90_24815 [Pseudomonadales bacterium]|nr:hypothetical protein [Pseudomonadales bacterium]